MKCEYLKQSKTEEVWVQITNEVVPDIKPYYYISNWGRVGSIAYGNFNLLHPSYDEDGYLAVLLRINNTITKEGYLKTRVTKRVNRLVMMSFYPIPKNCNELIVNHINSIRDDNHLWNLEWVTPYENTMHGIKYGNINVLYGEDSPFSKLTENDIYKIIELMKTRKYNYKELAAMFNVTPTSIRLIFSGKTWKQLNLDISDIDLEHCRRLAFTDEELESICYFFESHNINNKILYPNPIDVLRDCFYTLGLDKKYSFKSKKNSLHKILLKSTPYIKNITNKYNYNFIK